MPSRCAPVSTARTVRRRCLGATALIAAGVRSANVRANTAAECCTLSAAAFARLEHDCPSLMIRLMHNLLHSTPNIAPRLTAEVAALEG